MTLQNRVTPFSSIEVTLHHGLFMGNRGCLHDDNRQLISQGWRTKSWLICALSFQNRRRELMQPRCYTELFFLDEAVAFAAGHRPCAFCRPTAYHAFIDAWSGIYRVSARASVLDTALHQERVSRIRGRKHWQAELGTLPNGTFVVLPWASHRAWLKLDDWLLEWSHAGYSYAEHWTDPLMVEVLTPPSIVLILREGYQPLLHSSVSTI